MNLIKKGTTLKRLGAVLILLLSIAACGEDKGAASANNDGNNGEPLPEREVITVEGDLRAQYVGGGPPSVCDWGDGRVVVNLRIRDRKGEEDSRVVLPNAENLDGERVDTLLVDEALTLEAGSRLVVPRFDGTYCGASEEDECPKLYECSNTTFCEREIPFSVVPGSVRFVPSRVSFENLSVAILIDESKYIGEGDTAQDPGDDRHFAAKAFIDALQERFPGVEVAVYAFGGDGAEGVRREQGYTRILEPVKELVTELGGTEGGERPMWDAMKIAKQDLVDGGRNNAVLAVITGGGDTSSDTSAAEVTEQLGDTPVFFVHLGGIVSGNATLPNDELITMACQTGGNYYYELSTALLRKSVVYIADIIDGVWTFEIEAEGLAIEPDKFTTLAATMRLSVEGLDFEQTLEFEGGAQGNFGNRLFLPYR